MDFSTYSFSLRQLQYVVAIADFLSFRRAAEHCHVAQPSLSAQVSQLESALNVQLFERNKRRVMVTSAGNDFVARARTILREASDLEEAVKRGTDPFTRTVSIGVIPTIAPYLLPEIVSPASKRYPALQFVWFEEKTDVLLEKLDRGELDGAILALLDDMDDLAHVLLIEDPFVLALNKSHPLGKTKADVRLGDISEERILLLDDGHCFRDQALSVCEKVHAQEAGFRATSLPTLVQMTSANGGITILPKLAVAVENRNHSLRIRDFAPQAPKRTIALVWRKGSALERTLLPVGETLRDALSEKHLATVVKR